MIYLKEYLKFLLYFNLRSFFLKKILDLQDKCTAGGVLYTIAQVSRYSDGSSSICLLPFEHT